MVKRKYELLARFRGFSLYGYQGRVGGRLKWYWHLRGRNGKVTAEHGQAYNNIEDMVTVLGKMFQVQLVWPHK